MSKVPPNRSNIEDSTVFNILPSWDFHLTLTASDQQLNVIVRIYAVVKFQHRFFILQYFKACIGTYDFSISVHRETFNLTLTENNCQLNVNANIQVYSIAIEYTAN